MSGWRIALLVLLLPLSMGVQRPAGLGDVREVRKWSYDDYTRVVVELTRPARISPVKRLGADPAVARPERLYLDLEGVWVGREYEEGIAVEDGLLEGIRLGQNTLRRTRLVLDLERYERHRLLTLRSPDRVVIDVYGDRLGTASIAPHDDRPGRPVLPFRPLQTIVVDAGHGGKDPGAIGVGGIREKDVNLRLARLLRSRLQARGFDVIMTRDRDVFLDLEERTAVAESRGADLFLSIHANASRRRGARGFEIYTLDEGHRRHSLDVAARENGVSRREMDSLQRTMASLRTSETSMYASAVAAAVHQRVAPRLTGRYRGFPDLGLKKGPFYVLYLSSIPAMLVETAFLTNREDARLVRSDDFLGRFADGIAEGLVRYRDAQEPLAFGRAR